MSNDTNATSVIQSMAFIDLPGAVVMRVAPSKDGKTSYVDLLCDGATYPLTFPDVPASEFEPLLGMKVNFKAQMRLNIYRGERTSVSFRIGAYEIAPDEAGLKAQLAVIAKMKGNGSSK